MQVIRSKSFLKNYFNIFNKRYFNNVLRTTNLEWNDTDTSIFHYRADSDRKKIIPVDITISYTDNFNKFRNSLVHEMLHYYVNCYVMEFSRADWINFVNVCNREDYDTAMEIMLGSMHNPTWLMLARELNKKFKELNIKPFVHEDTDNAKDLHLIKCVEYQNEKSKGKINYICLPSNRLKKLKSRFNSNRNYIPRTDFFECELNYDNLDMSCLHETKGASVLKNQFVNFLYELGTINKSKIHYIGTIKL